MCEVRMPFDFHYVCIGVIRSSESVHKVHNYTIGCLPHTTRNLIVRVHYNACSRSRKFVSQTDHVKPSEAIHVKDEQLTTIIIHVLCTIRQRLYIRTIVHVPSLIYSNHLNIARSTIMHFVTILLCQ